MDEIAFAISQQRLIEPILELNVRLPSDGAYQSSLQFGKYRGTPIAILDEVTIKKISGQLAPGKRFSVNLRDVFPPIPNDDTQTAAPSVGRVQAPVVLDFAAVMPAPTVNVAPAPAPVVNVTNEVTPRRRRRRW